MDPFTEMGIMGSSSKASEGKSMAVDDQPQTFRAGSVVEVSSEEEGFKGSWFVAKILTLPKERNKGKALIQYQTLITDEESRKPLKESASLSFIRPLPPRPEPDQIFEVNDIVDAFHRDGWWVGVVSRVLDHRRYYVSFEEPGEQLEFDRSNLRVHLDWLDGKWVKPQKLQESNQKKVDGVEKLITNTFQKKRRKLQKCKSQLSPLVQGKEDNALEIVPVDHLIEEVEFSVHATLKDINQQKGHVMSRYRKEDCSTRARAKRKQPQLVCEISKPLSVDVPQAHFTEHTAKQADLSRVLGLEPGSQTAIKGTINIACARDCNTKENEVVLAVKTSDICHDVQPISSCFEDAPSTLELANMSPMLMKGIESGSQTAVVEIVSTTDCQTKENKVILAEKECKRSHGREHRSLCFKEAQSTLRDIDTLTVNEQDSSVVPDGVVNQQNDDREKTLEDRHPLLMKGNDSGTETAIIDVVSATDCKTKEDEVALGRKDCNMCQDEQPLSLCCEGAQSTLQDTDPSLMNGKDSREKPLEIEMRSPSTGAMGNGELMEGQDFLLLEDSPVWKAVRSMDVFQTMPQKPHFRPLLKAKEIAREGLAVGHMITFAALVQKATKLKMGDPIKSFTSILESLPELETLGFDIKSVKLRVNRLLFLKDKQERLLEKSKANATKVTEHSNKLTTLDAEIENIEKKMKTLAEKQTLLFSEWQIEKSKIAEVQEEEEGTVQDIQHTEMDFESIATSPW
ncbi:hypothetical protein SLE2022_131940 [Rubroshorea leprosula]